MIPPWRTPWGRARGSHEFLGCCHSSLCHLNGPKCGLCRHPRVHTWADRTHEVVRHGRANRPRVCNLHCTTSVEPRNLVFSRLGLGWLPGCFWCRNHKMPPFWDHRQRDVLPHGDNAPALLVAFVLTEHQQDRTPNLVARHATTGGCCTVCADGANRHPLGRRAAKLDGVIGSGHTSTDVAQVLGGATMVVCGFCKRGRESATRRAINAFDCADLSTDDCAVPHSSRLASSRVDDLYNRCSSRGYAASQHLGRACSTCWRAQPTHTVPWPEGGPRRYRGGAPLGEPGWQPAAHVIAAIRRAC